MNNLLSFYEKIKQFCEDHHMINQFILLGSPEQIKNREFDYRSFLMIPSSSSMSRDLSRPIYTLTFNCTVLDKCATGEQEAFVVSTERTTARFPNTR